MTEGGSAVTSGAARRAIRLSWLAFAGISGAFAVVNAVSVIDDYARLGRPLEVWEPWTWEMTSVAAWLALAPFILAAALRLRPTRYSWPKIVAAHVLLSLVVSLAHVGLMTGLRHLVYVLAGDVYDPGGSLGRILVYEYRKDLITYFALVLILPAIQLMLARRPATDPKADYRIEVRDGSRTVWLVPGDIEWAQSAGNYVELHGAFGTLLHRRTLAALEEELAPFGFKRIHRARIVRADRVKSIETRSSGDFDVRLASGDQLVGSRRFRERIG